MSPTGCPYPMPQRTVTHDVEATSQYAVLATVGYRYAVCSVVSESHNLGFTFTDKSGYVDFLDSVGFSD